MTARKGRVVRGFATLVLALLLQGAPVVCAADGLTLFGESPGFGGIEGGQSEEPAGTAREPGQSPVTYRVPGFDPIRDVPAFGNWKGVWQRSGTGHCYAACVLTHYFFQRVEFTGSAGEPAAVFLQKFKDAPFQGKPVLRLEGEEAFDLLARWLAVSKEQAEKLVPGGKLPVGPYTSLRDMTRSDNEACRIFRLWAEAIQYHLQTKADGPRYAGSIIKSKLGFLPGMGRDDVNKDGVNIIRDRISKDRRTVPVAFHPDGLKFRGHYLLVYEMREWDDRVELVTYDINVPPSDTDARPTIVTVSKKDWKYAARRADGDSAYDYELMTVPKPDGSLERRFFRKIVTNYEETIERNESAALVVSDGKSLATRLKGVGKFILEHLDPR